MRGLARVAVVVVAGVACTTSPPVRPGPAAFGVSAPDAIVLVVGESARPVHTYHDSTGAVITNAHASWTIGDAQVAVVQPDGRVSASAPGHTMVTSVVDGVRVQTALRVLASPDTMSVVDVFPAMRHQTIAGWEAAAGIGEAECNRDAVRRYGPEVAERAVDELGITRLRTSLRSGTESRVDPWPAFLAGTMTFGQWRATWMVPTNDNDDPYVADPAGFQWGYFDAHVRQVVLPVREALARRGERLSLTLNYVDFFLTQGQKAFLQMKDPAEFAELVLVTFQHMQETFGFVPDAVELLLEPENTAYDGADVGRALVATARRLREAGFTPAFIGPSTTRAANSLGYHDAMLTVPGAPGLLAELSYHTYTGTSTATRHAIRVRGMRDRIRTAMLEHIGAGFDGLYEDLTVANVSAWEQFTLAYCGSRDQLENGGVYYHVNQSDPSQPRVSLTLDGRLLRHVFAFVRPGAVRVSATSSDARVRVLAFVDTAGSPVVVVRASGVAAVEVRGLPPGTYGTNVTERLGAYNVEGERVHVPATGKAVLRLPRDGALTLYPPRGAA